MNKLKTLGLDGDAYDENNRKQLDEFEKKLTPEEQSILKTLKGRRMVRPEDSLNIDNFTVDSIDGLAPRLERGQLGLAPAKKAAVKFTTHDKLSFLNGEARAAKAVPNGHAESKKDSLTNGDAKTAETMQNGHSKSVENGVMNGDAKAAKTMRNGHSQSVENGVTNGNHPVNGHHEVEMSSMADLVAGEKSTSSASLDELTRHRLMSSLREQAEELETPYDTMVRFVDSVSVPIRQYCFVLLLLTSFQTTGSTSSTDQAWR